MQNTNKKKQNYTSHIALHTSQKGITLIALIITIIVMLILVGVTINVALNGGVFEKAEIAKTQTQREVEKEELTTIAIAAYDEKTKKIDHNKLELGEKYSIVADKTTEEKIVVTGQYGITWQIDVTSGKIEEYTVSTRVPFTNYIENGDNYYILGDEESDYYTVLTISQNPATYTMYIIENGSIRGNDSSSYEFIDKSEVAARLNFTEEQIEQMMNQLTNTTFDELDDDVLLVPSDSGVSAIPFKSNYTEIFFGSEWCSLNTEYELPTE